MQKLKLYGCSTYKWCNSRCKENKGIRRNREISGLLSKKILCGWSYSRKIELNVANAYFKTPRNWKNRNVTKKRNHPKKSWSANIEKHLMELPMPCCKCVPLVFCNYCNTHVNACSLDEVAASMSWIPWPSSGHQPALLLCFVFFNRQSFIDKDNNFACLNLPN